jgi:predicted amidohydrolase
MGLKRWILILLFVPILSVPAFGDGSTDSAGSSGELRIAAVQIEVQLSDLRSFAVFSSRVEALVAHCMTFDPDLIVFPEYTSVFLALIPYYPLIQESESSEDGLSRISARDPLVEGFRDLFLVNSGLAARAMDELFATLARRHGVAIIPGTYFAWIEGQTGVALVNRMVLYDKNGKIAYSQDKVFLTSFEEQLLGLSPGLLEAAEPFVLKGHRIGITICRDTFFSDWLQVHGGVDLWIDIKADGVAPSEEQRQRFLRAVPARIDEGNIPYGLTVCLTGSLLELLWSGWSSLAHKAPDQEVRYIEEAASPSEEQILLFTIGGQNGKSAQ